MQKNNQSDDRGLLPYKDFVKIITSDNGLEFCEHCA